MKIKYALAMLTALASSQAIAAAFEAGQRMYNELADRERKDMNYNAVTAGGYVIGVADSLENILFCIPEQATRGQVIQVAKNYITDHPELWNRSAAALIIEGFAKAWPCPAKNQ